MGNRSGKSDIIKKVSIQEYFKQSLEQALANQNVAAEEDTACYVVNLLTLFSRTEHFYEQTPDGLTTRPLAMHYADALQGRGEQRYRALQRLGDIALFVAGVFADSLQRKPIDVDYYIAMGGNAYAHLSDAAHQTVRWRALRTIFTELAQKFADFVDVLSEVCEQSPTRQDTDVLRAYELWLRTGSRRWAERLRALGIEPNRASGGLRSH